MNMASAAVSFADWREAAICRVEHLDPRLFFPDSPDEITRTPGRVIAPE